MIGVPTLRMAIMRATSPDAPPSESLIASAENVAFAKANLAELNPKLDAADTPRR